MEDRESQRAERLKRGSRKIEEGGERDEKEKQREARQSEARETEREQWTDLAQCHTVQDIRVKLQP